MGAALKLEPAALTNVSWERGARPQGGPPDPSPHAALGTPVRCFQPLTQFCLPQGKPDWEMVWLVSWAGGGEWEGAGRLGGARVQPLSCDGVRQLPSAERECVFQVCTSSSSSGGRGGVLEPLFPKGHLVSPRLPVLLPPPGRPRG